MRIHCVWLFERLRLAKVRGEERQRRAWSASVRGRRKGTDGKCYPECLAIQRTKPRNLQPLPLFRLLLH